MNIERARRTSAVMVALVCLVLCSAALPAFAGLIWEMRLENPSPVVGTMDTVVIRGVLFNSPASDQNLGVISGGSGGIPPGFDYEIGAFGFVCSGWQWGPDGNLQNQFQGVNLAPGQSFNFVYGRCVPPSGGYNPAIFEINAQLQLFRSSPERPLVGSSSEVVRWMVSNSAPVPITIDIDITPGSLPNKVNPTSRGVIPVAILTTATFDAATVDSTSVRFGAPGAEAAPLQSALGDVNGDGAIDLILHFDTQATGIRCGDTAAFLTGETVGGRMVQGSDSISTVGCR